MIESIKKMEILNLKKAQNLWNDEICALQINPLLANLFPLSTDEVISNFLSFKKIIFEKTTCQKNTIICPFNGIHLQARRSKKTNLLSFHYIKCKNSTNKNQLAAFQENFLYNSFAFLNNYRTPDDEKRITFSKNQFYKCFKQEWATKSGKGIYIYGLPRSGKTFWFCLLANKLIISEKVVLISSPKMAEIIKTSFHDEQAKMKTIKILKAINEADYLLLDDIGFENTTDWFYENYLLPILNDYAVNQKPVLFNSFFNVEILEKNIATCCKSNKIAKAIGECINKIVGNNLFLIRDKKYENLSLIFNGF